MENKLNLSTSLSTKFPPEMLWFNEKQVAEITGRALQSLRNDRSLRRGIPYTKLSRSVRYRLSDVLTYMNSRRVEPEVMS